MSSTPPNDQFGLVGTRLDDYDVERLVAAGGFGIVYFARHHTLGRPVAIKVLKVPEGLQGDGRATFLKLFLDEAKTIASLEHPAIVGVLGYRVSPMPAGGDAPWMALEWVEGETLAAQLVRRRGQGGRAPRECLRLLEPVFDALAVAHAKGIAHRDIKPANLMLPMGSTTGRFGVLTRVLDFGIAKSMEANAKAGSGMTETASPFQAFSMPYASFEQVSGSRTGPWTDVHALGLILVEMLTDQAPFAADDRGEQMLLVMAPTRPTPARFGVDVGPWEPVLAKALALKPGDRYANAGELLAALEAEVPAGATRGPVSELPAAPQPSARSSQQGASTTVPVVTERVRPAGEGVPRGRRPVLVAAVAGVALVAGLVGVWATRKSAETTATAAAVSTPAVVTRDAAVAVLGARDAAVLGAPDASLGATSDVQTAVDDRGGEGSASGADAGRSGRRDGGRRPRRDRGSDHGHVVPQ